MINCYKWYEGKVWNVIGTHNRGFIIDYRVREGLLSDILAKFERWVRVKIRKSGLEKSTAGKGKSVQKSRKRKTCGVFLELKEIKS